MFDTHCHLTFPVFADRVADVIAAARDAGVDRMITVGTTPSDAANAVTLAHQHEGIYATVGMHPHYTAEATDEKLLRETMHHHATDPRIVALGEMGLDYHYDDPPRSVQQRMFQAQLDVAAELASGSDAHAAALPCIIHNREATDDVLGMIAASGVPGARFVFHCFTGTSAEAERILETGAMISFTGIVTFKNASEIADASDRVPLDRMMVETDSPYLAPEPHRKVRPNEPRYVVHVAEFIARRRDMSFDDFVARMDANARRFFALPADE